MISGTGSGMGRAAALLFASEGAKVVGCDVNAHADEETARLVTENGSEMLSAPGLDVSTPEGATAWVEAAVSRFGGVDALYNNAGDARFAPFPTMTVEDYHYTLRHELDLVWHCTQAAWPQLVARGGGVVLNVGSIAGINGSRDLPQAAHVATKGAVIALTRQLAAEGAAVNIRANAISPGLIATPAVVDLLRDAPAMLMSMVHRTYNGRPGTAEEVAAAALFLISDESRYISGANLVVDAGTTSLI
jgi:NAD(P)-dependent dehydrogenase (short-subunit alcohol dehydrogenase family)